MTGEKFTTGKPWGLVGGSNTFEGRPFSLFSGE